MEFVSGAPMRPTCPMDPYDEPLRVMTIDGELVFLGPGKIGFSMTPAAARLTLHNLAAALEVLRSASPAHDAAVVILIVEDELLIREIAVTLLEDAGYVVIVAEEASAALRTLEEGREVHLLFTDVQMPGEFDGLQLAQLVRDRWPAVRLLVTSGEAVRAQQDLPAGGRFLPKPYAAADVLRHIDELTAVPSR